ncbi:unnamed protein product [Ixodes pacificus]
MKISNTAQENRACTSSQPRKRYRGNGARASTLTTSVVVPWRVLRSTFSSVWDCLRFAVAIRDRFWPLYVASWTLAAKTDPSTSHRIVALLRRVWKSSYTLAKVHRTLTCAVLLPCF